MVRRVINLVYKEVRGLHQAAYILGLFAFGSQLLALVRDRLLAGQFGAGPELDIYYAAFRIPDLLYVLFASTLSVYVLIPFVARKREEGGDQAKRLLSQIFSLFLVVYTVLALLIIVLAPYITPVLFPGIENQAELVTVTQILLLQPLLLGVSSLFGVVTQLGHRFVLYALSPLVYNIGIIFGIVFFYPYLGLSGIALGVVLGAFGHMLIQLPLVRKSSLAFRLTTKIDWITIKSVLAVSIPRAITLSCNQIVLLVLVGLASVMAVGSVSVLQFAYNLQSVPLAIIGVSYSVAAFPVLAELYAAKAQDKFKLHIITALRHIIFWSVPAAVLIIVLRAQIVRVVLGSGSFDWADTRLTAAILAVLVIALCAHAINLLMVRAFYAGGNTRTPLIVAVIGGLVAVASSYSFAYMYSTSEPIRLAVTTLMRVPDVAGSEVLALAFGYAIAIVMQSLALIWLVHREFKLDISWLASHLGRSMFAALLGGFMAYASLNFIVAGLNTDTFIGIALQGLVGGVAGVIGVVLGYFVLRSPELQEVLAAFHKRILKTDVVAPQRDVI